MIATRIGSCLIAMATYNEMENVPSLVSELMERYPECEILVVDDNSPDGTGNWCTAFAANNPKFNCIVRAGKQGLGTAVLAKFELAIQRGFEYLVTIDADRSHDPAELHRLLEARSEADVVVGSRYVDGGAIVNWPRRRRLASRLANAFARGILGIQVQDCSTGYRCYRVAKLAELDRIRFLSTGYAFYEEVLWRLQKIGATFTEVPITFTDRVLGESKAGFSEIVSAAIRLLTLRLRG